MTATETPVRSSISVAKECQEPETQSSHANIHISTSVNEDAVPPQISPSAVGLYTPSDLKHQGLVLSQAPLNDTKADSLSKLTLFPNLPLEMLDEIWGYFVVVLRKL
jgi:hypothetical protein